IGLVGQHDGGLDGGEVGCRQVSVGECWRCGCARWWECEARCACDRGEKGRGVAVDDGRGRGRCACRQREGEEGEEGEEGWTDTRHGRGGCARVYERPMNSAGTLQLKLSRM